MSAAELLDAYVAASTRSWEAYIGYRELRVSEAEVGRRTAVEAEVLAALKAALGGSL